MYLNYYTFYTLIYMIHNKPNVWQILGPESNLHVNDNMTFK